MRSHTISGERYCGMSGDEMDCIPYQISTISPDVIQFIINHKGGPGVLNHLRYNINGVETRFIASLHHLCYKFPYALPLSGFATLRDLC